MTVDEAIKHCEEVAEKNEEESNNWTYGASRINDDESRRKQYLKHAKMWHECASEYRQLAEWLRELRAYREARVGCEYCKHNFRKQHERPCSLCQRNFMDMFESEVNADEDSD